MSIDISKTIAPKSEQLNADDLIAGPRTITVTAVKLVSEDQPVAIHFVGDDGKPYKPCKSMRRVLVRAWGADGAQYVGKSMTLYLDESVAFGGKTVGGIRISHLSHIGKSITMALTATRATKKAYTVQVLATTQDESADLVRAGDAASSDGVAMYTAWLANLTTEQKEAIRQHHGRWSKSAKASDATRMVGPNTIQQQERQKEAAGADWHPDPEEEAAIRAAELAESQQSAQSSARPRRERGGLVVE